MKKYLQCLIVIVLLSPTFCFAAFQWNGAAITQWNGAAISQWNGVAISSSTTINIRVAASADDVGGFYVVGTGWGFNTLSTTTLMVGRASTTFWRYGFGMRFLAVNIPSGKTIDSATLTFDCDTSYSTTTAYAYIIGQLSATPATFSTFADFQARRGTSMDGADNTQRTTAQVSWTMAAQTAGNTYTSPEIKTVIQEIVNTVGAVTDLVLFVDDFDNRSDADGARRKGVSYDGNSSNAPLLSITYH